MSKRPPTPNGAGSRGSGNASNRSTSNTGSTRAPGQSGATSQQTADQANGAAQQKSGGSSAMNSANYRARRAAAMRATAPSKSAQPRLSERPGQKRERDLPWWRKINASIYATIGVVLAIVVVFVIIANRPSSTTANTGGTLSSPTVVKQVTNVSPSVIDAVGTGGVTQPFQATQGSPPVLTGSNGKPEVLYMGGDYCPFCAAERWSIIVALSRFGTFSNLHDMTSSSTDTYPSTPTFTFYGSSYTSQYVDFVPVEMSGSDPNTPLQTPTAQQQQLIATYDAPPYVNSQNAGAIPFFDIGNQYVLSGASYSPQVLQGWTRDQIAAKLSTPNDAVTRAIVGTANYMTAAICKQTQDKPANVCSDKGIQSLEQQLPKGS